MAFFEIGVELDDEPRAVVETKESDDDRALIATASALDPTHAPHGSELLDPPLAPQRSHSFEGDSELSSALHRVDGDRDSMLDAIERELYDPSRRRAAARSFDEKAGDADLESGEVSPPPSPPTRRVSHMERVPSVASPAGATSAHALLGTLKGVFLPCLQNILGVILFLRLTWITGQAGVPLATLIVLVCATSTLLTSLSLSALATNGKVEAGGPYYICSRNLGHEFGGAVGLLYYVGETIAASMYVLGAVEAGFESFGLPRFDAHAQVVAVVAMLMLGATVAVGVKHVNRFASVFLGIVLLSICCALVGVTLFATGEYAGALAVGEDRAFGDNFGPAWERDRKTGITPTFWSLLALFYPSVTGIMAGSNRSGVLKSPTNSIPRGTVSAVVLTTLLYVGVVWVFGSVMSNETLKNEKLVVALVAWPHPLVVKLGIVMSCIGAALQSLTSAPRLLTAIAADDLLPALRPLKPTTPSAVPNRAVALTVLIAALPCLAGNLDFITPIITMFFLVMYATVNLACFVLAALRAPGFRPTWRYFSWWTALLGFVWCVGLMYVISWFMATVALALGALLVLYIRSQHAHKDWGDSLVGLRFELARDQLLALRHTSTFYHAKNWRPQLLVLLETDARANPLRPELLALAGSLKKGRGLVMAVALLRGEVAAEYEAKGEAATEVLRLHMHADRIEGFPRVIVYARDLCEAMLSTIQSSGIGAMRPNTVVVGWPASLFAQAPPKASGAQHPASALWRAWSSEDRERAERFVAVLHGAVGAKKALVVLKGGRDAMLADIDSSHALHHAHVAMQQANIAMERVHTHGTDPAAAGAETSTIDVWWVVHDGGLLLLLPHLLRQTRRFRTARMRVFAVLQPYAPLPIDDDETRRAPPPTTPGGGAPPVVGAAFAARLEAFLEQIRIEAEVIPVALDGDGSCDAADLYSDTLSARGRQSIVSQIQRRPDALSRHSNARHGVSRSPTSASRLSPTSGGFGGAPVPDAVAHRLAFDGAPSAPDEGPPPLELPPPAVQSIERRPTDDEPASPALPSPGGEKRGGFARATDSTADAITAQRLRTARALNTNMRRHSSHATLIVTNLPLMMSMSPVEFLMVVDVMTRGLEAVMLVRGSGKEVVTTYG